MIAFLGDTNRMIAEVSAPCAPIAVLLIIMICICTYFVVIAFLGDTNRMIAEVGPPCAPITVLIIMIYILILY